MVDIFVVTTTDYGHNIPRLFTSLPTFYFSDCFSKGFKWLIKNVLQVSRVVLTSFFVAGLTRVSPGQPAYVTVRVFSGKLSCL